MEFYCQDLDSATTVLEIQSFLVCHSVLTGVTGVFEQAVSPRAASSSPQDSHHLEHGQY